MGSPVTTASRAGQEVPGWRDLRHGGLLLDGQRLADLAPHAPDPLDGWTEHQLRRRATDLRRHATDGAPAFAKFVLEEVCGFDAGSGTWTRGAKVAPEWSRRAPTGEVVKPRQLWEGIGGGRLPVFMEPGPRVGIGKGRRTVSRVLGWLRAGNDHLALITNGKQWRLLFAGLDFEAWCEWDMDLWFQDGKPAPQVDALRTLLQPKLWTPASKDAASPLLQAIRDTRKGQAELSETLGERVREAVEVLIQGHGEALKEQCSDVDPADIYRAACRVAMRLVVILFAEARDLLPRDNPVYHASYGLNGLMERLQSAAGGHALSRRFSAWPQVQALFTLVHDGSHLPQMPVKDYGGELFKPGSAESADGLSRALAVFETACLKQGRTAGRRRSAHAGSDDAHAGPNPSGPGRHPGHSARGLLGPVLRLHRHTVRRLAGLRAQDVAARRARHLPGGGPLPGIAVVAPGGDGRQGDQGAVQQPEEGCCDGRRRTGGVGGPSRCQRRGERSRRRRRATRRPQRGFAGRRRPAICQPHPRREVGAEGRARGWTGQETPWQAHPGAPTEGRGRLGPKGPQAGRSRRVARRVVLGAVGRHPKGVGQLLHATRLGRAHGAAHVAAFGLRPSARQGRRTRPRRSCRKVDAQAPRADP